MFSAKQRQNLRKSNGDKLTHSVLSKIWAKKSLKTKKKNCADLPIFYQDNCQNTKNQLETTCFSQDRDEICLKTPKYGRNVRFLQNFSLKLTKTLNSTEKHVCFFCKNKLISVLKTLQKMFSAKQFKSLWENTKTKLKPSVN